MIVLAVRTGDQKMASAEFFRAPARLSDRIYKICTLLSTGFVDNRVPGAQATGLEAATGAVFRGRAGFPARLAGDAPGWVR